MKKEKLKKKEKPKKKQEEKKEKEKGERIRLLVFDCFRRDYTAVGSNCIATNINK